MINFSLLSFLSLASLGCHPPQARKAWHCIWEMIPLVSAKPQSQSSPSWLLNCPLAMSILEALSSRGKKWGLIIPIQQI